MSLAKCQCLHCGGTIEFDEDSAGQEAECPHCHVKTWIDLPGKTSYIPPHTKTTFRLPKKVNWKLELCKMKWTLGIVLGVLVIGNVFFAGLFISWRDEAHRLETSNSRLEQSKRMVEESNAELTSNVQAAIESQEIAGIYRLSNSSRGIEWRMDLRSDGTGQFQHYENESPISSPWNKISSKKIIVSKHGQFKIENGDLIDEEGNRWLHVR